MDREKVENEKRSKKLTICLYLIPLILAVIIALVYIFIQQNFLLIIFAVLMFVIYLDGMEVVEYAQNVRDGMQ